MDRSAIRQPAVAGSWYPGRPEALEAAIDAHLDQVAETPSGEVLAVVAPHAGLVYSGPVAAYAYRAVAGRRFDVAVLVGPSHFVGFEGVSVYERGAFDTPLGAVPIDEPCAQRIAHASDLIRPYPAAHTREHSLEMQLPFVQRVLPETPIVPLLMGYQTRRTILDLAEAIDTGVRGRRALLIASTDLSHYFEAETAAELDGRTAKLIGGFDVGGFLEAFESYPEDERGRYVACGGGPAIAVMEAARRLGATEARVLRYADSGDVSGDKDHVVGYLAAAFGTFVC